MDDPGRWRGGGGNILTSSGQLEHFCVVGGRFRGNFGEIPGQSKTIFELTIFKFVLGDLGGSGPCKNAFIRYLNLTHMFKDCGRGISEQRNSFYGNWCQTRTD